MKLLGKFFAVVVLISVPFAALAMDKPYFSKAATVNGSTTITGTNTFQSVFVAQDRAACKIQNNGSHTMWVFFGPIASSTAGTSIVLAAGLFTTCGEGGVVRRDQVSITGTAGDAFFADQQL